MNDKENNQGYAGILSYLPEKIEQALDFLPKEGKNAISELRLRLNQPIRMMVHGVLQILYSPNAKPLLCSEEDMKTVVYRITQGSIYALEEELRRGYITLAGGHRVGIAGRVLLLNGQVDTIRDISSLNFRIAHEVKGCGKKLMPYLMAKNSFYNTLIFSPPCAGKTTLLRDLSVLLAAENKNIALIDERSEIAGCFLGQPQLYVGNSTDILDGAPKCQGMMMAIRSLSPDIIITDEIGKAEEETAVLEAVNAGVSLLLSAHGRTLEEVAQRPLIANLLKQKVFQRLVQLSSRRGPGTVEQIYNKKGEPLL